MRRILIGLGALALVLMAPAAASAQIAVEPGETGEPGDGSGEVAPLGDLSSDLYYDGGGWWADISADMSACSEAGVHVVTVISGEHTELVALDGSQLAATVPVDFTSGIITATCTGADGEVIYSASSPYLSYYNGEWARVLATSVLRSVPQAAAGPATGSLARSGGDIAGLTLAGLACVGLGTALVWRSRRRPA